MNPGIRVCCFCFFQAEDGIRDIGVTGVQTCALPICQAPKWPTYWFASPASSAARHRSEEHTSELQSRQYLVCRLLLEKKNQYYASAAAETLSRWSARRTVVGSVR